MQTLLDKPPTLQGASMDVGQIRRLIREVFPGADVRHVTLGLEQVTVDECFNLQHSPEDRCWYLSSIHEREGDIEVHRLGKFTEAQNAVRRLVVLMATARVEAAIGKAVIDRG
jgi:hypothetical protein